jgi:hypothetical protein
MAWNAADLLFQILAEACPSSEPDEEGYNHYLIETHCRDWDITARKTPGGGWEIKAYS